MMKMGTCRFAVKHLSSYSDAGKRYHVLYTLRQIAVAGKLQSSWQGKPSQILVFSIGCKGPTTGLRTGKATINHPFETTKAIHKR